MKTRNSVFFTMANRSRFGMVHNTAFSMESDCAPLENVKDFSSTLVRLLRARAPFTRAILCVNRSDRLGLTRLTKSWASRNLRPSLFPHVCSSGRKTAWFCEFDLHSNARG